MMKHATFHFYGNLVDFLARKGSEPLIFPFTGTPSIKDSIEAIGIPHVEVSRINANRTAVPFTYLLKDGDQIEVYPTNYMDEAKEAGNRFLVDSHLGKLAKDLRLLGFDTIFQQTFTLKEMLSIAETENRIVLSRSRQLLKNKALKGGYWIRSEHPGEQLREVVQRFNLCRLAAPFQRCLICNGTIIAVTKETILHNIPPKTFHYFNDFYQCSSCGRIYWKGSHYERMQQKLKEVGC